MPGSICDVLPAAAALLSVSGAVDSLGLVDQLGDVRRVLVVLVDGMGWHLLPALTGDAPLLASVLAGGDGRLTELACTFPSMTATNLASLGTGVAPGQHGILGMTVKLPDGDRVLNHLGWRDNPPPAQWQPVPTWFERLARRDVSVRAVVPAVHIGSGLTEAAFRGAKFDGSNNDDDSATQLVDQLRAAPGLVYGYTGALDTAAHIFGIGSPEWHAAAAHVDELLSRLREALPSDAALLITADHGGLNVSGSARIDVDTDPQLSSGVRTVAGDPRVRYLHTEPGGTADVIATWRELLGGRADVRCRDEAVAAGLFGVVRPEHLPRIGDVVVTCRGDVALQASVHDPPEMAQLIGFHGAKDAVETAIPLIAFRG